MLNSETKLLAVIGNPIEHSLSPLIHNAGIIEKKLNYVYVAFKVTNVETAILAMRELNFSGYSVTIPHKISIMNYLDEIDPLAKKIGAVNTVVNNNGKLIGYNTDSIGAMNSIKERIKLKGKTVYVFGAGGAARAIVAGLKEERANVKIFNRTAQKAKALAQEFDCDYAALGEIDTNYDILINTTPIGMHPNTKKSPIDKKILKKGKLIFDVVYNPINTTLLKQAKNAGCVIIEGWEMFLEQAFIQFKLFTNKNPPKEIMEKKLLTALNEKQN